VSFAVIRRPVKQEATHTQYITWIQYGSLLLVCCIELNQFCTAYHLEHSVKYYYLLRYVHVVAAASTNKALATVIVIRV
jgi:hypothetical protein